MNSNPVNLLMPDFLRKIKESVDASNLVVYKNQLKSLTRSLSLNFDLPKIEPPKNIPVNSTIDYEYINKQINKLMRPTAKITFSRPRRDG